MAAVRRAEKDAARKGWTDTDSDHDSVHSHLTGTSNLASTTHLLPIAEQNLFKEPERGQDELTTVVVFGADGNLSRKKTFPALFSLVMKELLAVDTVIVGYAREAMTTDQFRDVVLKSIYSPTVPSQPRNDFLAQVTYEHGQFDDPAAFTRLREAIEAREAKQLEAWKARYQHHAQGPLAWHGQGQPTRVRLYYLAVPSFLYLSICRCLRETGIAKDERVDRFVLEKPFGRDSQTCAALLDELSTVLSESVSYRIDHYLGKELIMNLLVLRFANIAFGSIWNRQHVASVQVIFKVRGSWAQRPSSLSRADAELPSCPPAPRRRKWAWTAAGATLTSMASSAT